MGQATALQHVLPLYAPADILDDGLRNRATRRIAKRLRAHAGGNFDDPETWIDVATRFGIDVYEVWYGGSGRLVYDRWTGRWEIYVNANRSCRGKACVLVHELAEWFLRTMECGWLFDRSVVYLYDGNATTERHEIARRVERAIMGGAK